MITYPSTHGVFEETVREVCEITHEHGGQVYLDGANMNAMVGLSKPGEIGSDVSHSTCTRPSAFRMAAAAPAWARSASRRIWRRFLPGHPETGRRAKAPVSAAPFGSASILPISWAYFLMMGGEGLTQATKVAILNANYIAKRLEGRLRRALQGSASGRVAHECIIDTRPFEEAPASPSTTSPSA